MTSKASSPRVLPGRRGSNRAAKADRHELYELSVQAPESDAATLARLFKRLRKRDAMSMREDFCGTAALSSAWVRSKEGRTAVGIDLDQPTMDWGLAHRIEPHGPDVARRLELIRANVLDGAGPKVDLAAGLNFSYCILHERRDLLAYFKAARRKLVDDGVFMLDVFGGWESMQPQTNVRKVPDGFTYRWEQRSFDPLTHHIVCSICFDFRDGSSIEDAFHYDWRLWTSPELRDVLLEAGFSEVHLMWERTNAKGEGTGAFYEPKKDVENQDSWWTYIVAER
ncbi:class I SAM-dependent methyltransferase [Paraliomyxa miuraensis]|uniref:class I SAM-dependent methyltransferase n=1 Tax=Paraliomyxa miuraensis TaxID=376150 RepID=UPI0022514502|nr:class I SAM-dependent methyltransferase [Paraliomyxa miuraensis]MCX4248008.1 class I SAM-dependent methyltransferase [Paraliomyxa miuraensis]